MLRWGRSSEYVLGALVLGHSIRRSGSKHARVCLYADDVPPSCIALLSRIWDCRPVQHIAVAADKLGNFIPGHRFAKVFTKLRALELVEFEKILVLDIDIFVCPGLFWRKRLACRSLQRLPGDGCTLLILSSCKARQCRRAVPAPSAGCNATGDTRMESPQDRLALAAWLLCSRSVEKRQFAIENHSICKCPGDVLDGRDFFMGRDFSGWSWGQGTGQAD